MTDKGGKLHHKGQALPENFARQVPDGDSLERMVCDSCGFVAYENPKVVVGAVVTWQDEILLCRRAIDPRRGFWTIPAGYLELHETPPDGARREAREEACAEIVIDQLLAVYAIPRLSQVQLIYRAGLERPEFAAGEESLEAELFAWPDIPWPDLAFPSVHWALRQFHSVRGLESFPPLANPPGESGDFLPRAGASADPDL